MSNVINVRRPLSSRLAVARGELTLEQKFNLVAEECIGSVEDKQRRDDARKVFRAQLMLLGQGIIDLDDASRELKRHCK